VASRTEVGKVANRKQVGNRSHRVAYFWTKLTNTPFRKTALWAILFARHLGALVPLLLARQGSNLHRLVKARPEIFELVLAPYVAANWAVRTRLARIVDHCKTVEAIGSIMDFLPGTVVDLIRPIPSESQYRITLDQQRWLVRKGLLFFSLWHGVDRIFQLGFSLSSQDGNRVVYIGDIQGRSGPDMLDRYRAFTKEAIGMRPRDFLVEVFKMFCRALDITDIRAVTDANHCSQHFSVSAAEKNEIRLSYDEIWLERGGICDGNGFFALPLARNRRADEDIPAKKRAMYHKRYSMLDVIETELTAVLKTGPRDCQPAS